MAEKAPGAGKTTEASKPVPAGEDGDPPKGGSQEDSYSRCQDDNGSVVVVPSQVTESQVAFSQGEAADDSDGEEDSAAISISSQGATQPEKPGPSPDGSHFEEVEARAAGTVWRLSISSTFAVCPLERCYRCASWPGFRFVCIAQRAATKAADALCSKQEKAWRNALHV